ncbi:hypothetical protein [Pararcticibacter amylolyticus]|uniref:Uncharacterized protein n=1 Tax=Pararcticibacter amylolyticus TaxID=2173175 RepID=A0A2U2PLA2_9SPHI|nr:hypothetical protein [Pararcticibacter amylolyticus]PWG82064.1 hypothetical protein DDR33_03320 [Pararcticibacter amylolyticus]
MIEKENFPMEDDNLQGQDDESSNNVSPLDLEEQEQRNDDELVQRLEEEDTVSGDYGDIYEATGEPSKGEEDLENFTERTLPGTPGDPGPVGTNSPLTKNLLGDNPPGSEQAAFEAGNAGDMTSNEAKYRDSEIEQNFRENIEKAKEEIALDKKLKGGA